MNSELSSRTSLLRCLCLLAAFLTPLSTFIPQPAAAQETNCVQCPSGLIAWWPGDGSTTNLAGTGNGTLHNGATFTNAQVGPGFYLDGINNFVQAPRIISGLTNLSFLMWIRIESFTHQYYMAPFCQSESSVPASSRGIAFYCGNAANSFGFYAVAQDGTSLDLRTAIPFGVGVWKHVAVTYDGVTAKQYVDGILLNERAYAAKTLGNTEPFLVGKGYAYPNNQLVTAYFSGQLDELQIFNRALPSDEIAAMYAAGTNGMCKNGLPPTLLTWPTNEFVVLGSSVTLTAAASGTEPLYYRWLFYGTNLPGATLSTLNLHPSSVSDSGPYSCLVSNAYGTATSPTARLTVQSILDCGLLTNRTLRLSDSPYLVLCNLELENVAIEPGVRIEAAGNFEIKVRGGLRAVGTDTQPIVLTTTDPSTTKWQGILFDGSTADSELAYCIVENSINSGLRINEASPVLRHCQIRRNQAVYGAGIRISGSVPVTLEGCTISENTYSGTNPRGGGIYTTSRLTLIACKVLCNAISDGRGCWGSSATTYGGAVYSTTDVVLQDVEVIGNTASSSGGAENSRGGGVYTSGRLFAQNSIFANNYAGAGGCNIGDGARGWGGGVYCSSTVELRNCIIANNATRVDQIAHAGGGGVYAAGGLIENCTLAYNTQGGVQLGTGGTIVNSILWGNSLYQYSGATSVTFSCVQGIATENGNIANDPLLPPYDPAAPEHLGIPCNSPCVDAGNPAPEYQDPAGPLCVTCGTARNDMGAHGGPGACAMHTAPKVLNNPETFEFISSVLQTDRCGTWQIGLPTSGPPVNSMTGSHAYSPFNCAATLLGGNYAASSSGRLITPSFTVPAVSPGDLLVFRFWQWYQYGTGDAGLLQVSVGTGAEWFPWETIGIAAPTNGSSSGWQQFVAELTPYRGQQVRLGFLHTANSDGSVGPGWYIDDVEIFSPAPAPDLRVVKIVAPGEVMAGQPVPVSFLLTNQGSLAALGPWTNTIALASASIGSGAQTIAALAFAADLPATSSVWVTADLRLPATIGGARYLMVAADSADQVWENLREHNNTLVSTERIYISTPDLAVVSVEAPAQAQFGQSHPVSWAVTNAGTGPAAAGWSDRIYLSPTESLGTNAVPLATYAASIVPLGGAQGYMRTAEVTLPLTRNTHPGTWYVVVETDHARTQDESNETNNWRASAPITLDLPTLPDLTVAGVTAPGNAWPTEVAEVSWTVANQGTTNVVAVWNESVFLATNAVTTNRWLLERFVYTNALAAGGLIARTQSVTVPAAGPAGDLWFVVQVDSGDTVFESDEANNVGAATNVTGMPLALTLNLHASQVREDAGNTALLATITRNGQRSNALVVWLSPSDTNELTVPPSVTIPIGQASVSFAVAAVRDWVVDGPKEVTLSAMAPDFAGDTALVTVLDADVPRLFLEVPDPVLIEGGTGLGILSREFYTGFDLTVFLSSPEPNQLSVPLSIVIPSNQGSTVFSVAAVENLLIESPRMASLSASAAGFSPTTAMVTILDNDLPSLSLALLGPSISEGDGSLATFGKVTRSFSTGLPLVAELESDLPSKAIVPASVTIPAGQASAWFPVAAVDNAIVDGPQTVVLSAFATETLTGERIGVGASSSLTVLDDDGPTLSVSLPVDALAEGDTVTGVVTRSGPIGNPLVVNLASSDATAATVPANATIPGGASSVSFTVIGIVDGVVDGDQVVTISASADGFTGGLATLIVTDLLLPDLVVTNVVVLPGGEAGSTINVSYRVVNQGSQAATNTFRSRVFFSCDPYIGDDTQAGEASFPGPLPVGAYFDQSLQLRLPLEPTNFWVVVLVDAAEEVAELIEYNNFRLGGPITVSATYEATVQAGVVVAPAGTPVPLQGRATLVGTANGAPFEPVNIHILVRGMERIIAALTDASGDFTATFHPLPGEAGHYEIFATHPGVSSVPVQDEFDLLGMRFNPASTAHVVLGLGTITNEVVFENLGDAALSGLNAAVLSAPAGLDVQPELPHALPGSANVLLRYTVQSLADAAAHGTAIIRVTSAEGVWADLPVQVTVQPLVPRLVARPESLSAAMLRGAQTLVEFDLQNEGGRETGPLNVVLPAAPWLSTASPNPLPSLAPGASARVTLQLLPPPDLVLGPYSGSLVVSGTGLSLSLPFEFRAISEAIGGLKVTTVDEFTYFAESAPRVTNATVLVIDATTGETVAKGVSGPAGEIMFPSLFEAFCHIEVRAPGHGDYRATVLIAPGQLLDLVAFMPRQLVTYTWVVVPTEVPDRYTFRLETTFETYVPVPVVVLDPAALDLSLITNEVTQINLTIANHGLVAARGLKLHFGSHPSWQLTALVQEIGELPPLSSRVVPLTVRRLTGMARTAQSGGVEPCEITAHVDWWFPCGPDNQYFRIPFIVFNASDDCSYSAPSPPPWNPPPRPPSQLGQPSRPVWGPGGEFVSVIGTSPVIPHITVPGFQVNIDLCNPCVSAIASCALGFVGPVKPILEFIGRIDTIVTCLQDPHSGACLEGLAGEIEGLGDWLGIKACVCDISKECNQYHPLLGPVMRFVAQMCELADTLFDTLVRLLGNAAWLTIHPDDIPIFHAFWRELAAAAAAGSDEGARVSSTELAHLLTVPRPRSITDRDVEALVERWNETLRRLPGQDAIGFSNRAVQSNNYIDLDALQTAWDEARAMLFATLQAGYINLADGPRAALALAQAETQPGEGACARVRLRIDQDAVMTRSAFAATLELNNRSDSSILNVSVQLEIRDALQQPAEHLFGAALVDWSGFAGVNGAGTLLPGQPGRGTWRLVPSPEAAPTGATVYYVSGTLAYVQDRTAAAVPLFPQRIVVRPQPRLEVSYFQPREVYADDPFTPEVEPPEPFVLGLLVRNSGHGAARNFSITTSEPQIVENEGNLLVDFQILGSQVGDRSGSPALTVELGDIQPGAATAANWLMTASLSGKFLGLNASFQHLDDLGRNNLSLIEGVSTHVLVHAVQATTPGSDNIPDFLTDDVPDVTGLPDTLHLSDGSRAAVSAVTEAAVQSPEGANVTNRLLLAPMPSGWCYLRIADPVPTGYRLSRVVRTNDNLELLLGRNVWTTHRVVRVLGQAPWQEDLLHLFDYNSMGAYWLFYEPMPSDTEAPSSHVAPLPSGSFTHIPVSWSGEENAGGSGLAHFDIFVSEGEGPFTVWLAQTTLRSADFVGLPGSRYSFYSVATDFAGNREAAPGTPDAQTTVTLYNAAPSLPPIGNLTVDEGTTLVLQCTATDGESPPQTLTYRLTQGPPGAVINPQTGLLTWATGEAHGDSINYLTVCVTDNGMPPMSDCQSFTVLVQDINLPPTVCPQPLLAVSVGDELSITNCAFDPDIPAQNLGFSLGWASDTNATINPTNGVFQWRPSVAFASTTNFFAIVATDDGWPSLSATQWVTVLVNDYLALGLGRTEVQIGREGGVALGVFSSAGVSEVEGLMRVEPGHLDSFNIFPLSANMNSVTVQPASAASYRLRAEARPERTLLGTENIAWLGFTALSNRSAIVPLVLSDVVALKPGGERIPKVVPQHGRVVVVGVEPLVEAIIHTNGQPALVLYAQPGTRCTLETAVRLDAPVAWQPWQPVVVTNLFEIIQPIALPEGALFIRAIRER